MFEDNNRNTSEVFKNTFFVDHLRTTASLAQPTRKALFLSIINQNIFMSKTCTYTLKPQNLVKGLRAG